MSLLEPPPDTSRKSRPLAFTVAALVLVAIVGLWWIFRFYPEKRAAEHFFDAVVAGDMAKAYELWKPRSELQDGRLSGRLGAKRLLRPGEKLQNHPRRFAARLERGADCGGDQRVFADAES